MVVVHEGHLIGDDQAPSRKSLNIHQMRHIAQNACLHADAFKEQGDALEE